MLFDTHTHLNDKHLYADLDGVIERATESGVTRMICPGYDIPTSRLAVEISRKYSNVWATIGVHPHHAAEVDDEMKMELTDLARQPKVVAIGEAGLDYYRDLSPRPVQAEVFRFHIRLAKEVGKPLVIHNRDAGQDVFDILVDEGIPEAGAVLHCFSEDIEYAARVTEMGVYLGIAGPVTYNKNDRLWEVAREAREDRLLIETDAPYLTPQPHRGRKRNEPAYVRYVAEKIAELRGTDIGAIGRITTENALRVFKGVE